MVKSLLLFISCFLSIIICAQTTSFQQKENRISGGFGIAGAAKNSVSIGQYLWLQHSYRFAPKVSIATEYENMVYKQPSFYNYAPADYNKLKLYDHNISLLFKYVVLDKNNIKIGVASGWTYCIRQQELYEPLYIDNGVFWSKRVSSFSEYKIPLLAEIEYPILKTMNLQARMRYNLVANDRSTYGAGIGASLKL